MSEAKFHHNSSLKQQNRPFKKAKKPGTSKKPGGARVPLKQLHLRESSMKTDRINHNRQLQKQRRADLITSKRLGTEKACPRIVGVIALSPHANLDELKQSILAHPSVEDARVPESHPSVLTVTVKDARSQRFTFFFAPRDPLAICDITMMSDVVLLLMTPNGDGETVGEDAQGFTFCKVAKAAGLPSCIGVYQGVAGLPAKKKPGMKKLISRYFETAFEEPHKVLGCESQQELSVLFRWIANLHVKPLNRDERAYLLGESAQFTPEPGDPKYGTLAITGYLRGRPLSPNQLVHLTGHDDFKQSHITSVGGTVIETSDENRATLVSLQPINPLSLEQSLISEEEIKHSQAANRPAAGALVDYQAVWDEISDDDEGKLDNLEDADMHEPELVHDRKDSEMTSKSEASHKSKLERDENFPDEVDTPEEGLAKVRFQRYRGLKNFKHSDWDPKESLPVFYSQIFQLEDFKNTQKLVMSQDSGKAQPNESDRVRLHLVRVPVQTARLVCSSTRPICIWGLFEHEHKVSVLHCNVKRNSDVDLPVKGKDEMLFQIGFRRSAAKPVYTDPATARGKALVQRYLKQGSFSVASIFGRLQFGTTSVLMFTNDGHEVQLVAWGSYLGADADRVLVKRVVLTGYPVGVHKRSAVVKRMFYNADDIRWFKPVELWTKYGLVGHIKEPRGTKGYLKASFDGFIKNHDTVCMSLYKRQYPPWNAAAFEPAESVSIHVAQ